MYTPNTPSSWLQNSILTEARALGKKRAFEAEQGEYETCCCAGEERRQRRHEVEEPSTRVSVEPAAVQERTESSTVVKKAEKDRRGGALDKPEKSKITVTGKKKAL